MLFRCLLLLWQKELQLHRIPCWVLPDILCSTNSPHHYHVHCHASQSLEIFNIYRIKVRIGLQAYIRLTCYFQWFHILEKVWRQRRELLCWCLWSYWCSSVSCEKILKLYGILRVIYWISSSNKCWNWVYLAKTLQTISTQLRENYKTCRL